MKVAVVGAGACGLTAIKCCLDEGLEVTCYERTNEIGGLWNYKDDVKKGQASVMKSTVINTSKEMMCYSDYPIPPEFPVFMHNKYVQKYFMMYAEQFNLLPHIKFQTEVISIRKASDFASTGQWNFQVRDKVKDRTEELVYDAVLICTGHHADIHMPTFPGLDKFKGTVIHSNHLRHPNGLEDKRIVIVGIGNSGGDAAVEMSRVASQVFLSTRRGTWVLSRTGDNGMPVDMLFTNRLGQFIARLCPNFVIKTAEKIVNKRFDHVKYSLKPKHNLFAQHPFVNDALPDKILTGAIQIKPNVEEFTESGVKFDDGTFEDNIDMVLLATGYVFGFPFLDKSVLDVQENRATLYKYMFPVDLEKQTLAVVGFVQPLGALMPIAELQCRLATRVFKGDVVLPSKREQLDDIHQKQEMMARRYVHSQRHTIQVDYIPFMDELATLNGCKPNLRRLFFRDPTLAMKCVFDCCSPYQYRLEGPGAWPGARHAIMTQWDRTLKPLQTRKIDTTESSKSNWGFLWFFLVFVSIFFAIYSRFC